MFDKIFTQLAILIFNERLRFSKDVKFGKGLSKHGDGL